jgi:hypothetical protein
MRLLQVNEVEMVSGMGPYYQTDYDYYDRGFACYPMRGELSFSMLGVDSYQNNDSAAFSFVKAVLRAITGALRTDSYREKFILTTPDALGIRG